MYIQILIDNPDSWIIPYAEELQIELETQGHKTVLIHDQVEVQKGDVLCLLSCENIFTRLDLNTYNLVVHESDLPLGKGWSPLTWQILEGKDKIPVTLFEAANSVDSGDIYDQYTIELDGTELLPEIKRLQGIATKKLIIDFINHINEISPKPQKGQSSYYRKRNREDSRVDLNKSINEQFNLLRVCDNERYPAFFEKDGVTYLLKIYKK